MEGIPIEILKTPPVNNSSRFPDGFRILQGKQEYITYLEHSSIRIWPSDVAAHYDSHMHSAIEIILPHRGTSVYHLPNQVYRVNPGEILIIPSGWTHALTEPQDTLRYLLLFEPEPLMTLMDLDAISEVMRQPIYLHDDADLQHQAGDLLMQAVNCYMQREPLWNTRCYAYLFQFYALLGKRYLRVHAPQQPTGQHLDPAIMNSALAYINENYQHDLVLEDVAAFAGFSKYYFSRLFKQFCGMSFPEYLTQKRLKAATSLLVSTSKSMQDIAQEAGFGSVATFNRVFRKSKNCTPTQFRAIYGTALSM